MEDHSSSPPNRKLLGKDWPWYKKKLIKHFLPLGFAAAITLSLAWPWPGQQVGGWDVSLGGLGNFTIASTLCVCLIFVISGLTLKTDDIKKALGAYTSLIYGVVAILFITAMLGFVVIHIPFDVKEFATGLAVFTVVPTTLSSGVTLVGQAYGNSALALMLTVTTNLLGIVTVPLLLKEVIASASDVSIDAVKLLSKLILTILIPLIIGKVVRGSSSAVRAFVTRWKVTIGLVNNGALICIVWQTISRSQEEIVSTKFVNILAILAAGIGLHFVFLAINLLAVKLLRLPEPEMKAVWLMASQKTLPVSVTVISFLNPAKVGNRGLITLPAICGHVAQLFIDAVIVSRMATVYEAREAAAEAGELEAAPEPLMPPGKRDSTDVEFSSTAKPDTPASAHQVELNGIAKN